MRHGTQEQVEENDNKHIEQQSKKYHQSEKQRPGQTPEELFSGGGTPDVL